MNSAETTAAAWCCVFFAMNAQILIDFKLISVTELPLSFDFLYLHIEFVLFLLRLFTFLYILNYTQ